MANIADPTPDEIAAWNAWVAARPEAVRKVAERFFPWKLYRLASSGHRVTLLSFGEQTDGKVTVQVAVTGQFNRVAFERRVFGISPDDLTECDLPAEGEELGSMDLDPFEAMDLVRLGEAMAPISSGEVISVTRELTPTGEVVETTIRNEKVIAAHPGYLITGCFGPLETPES